MIVGATLFDSGKEITSRASRFSFKPVIVAHVSLDESTHHDPFHVGQFIGRFNVVGEHWIAFVGCLDKGYSDSYRRGSAFFAKPECMTCSSPV
jgi:hypothetical protein